MVIVVGNGIDTRVQIIDDAGTLRKGMNPTILPPAMDTLDRLDSLSSAKGNCFWKKETLNSNLLNFT